MANAPRDENRNPIIQGVSSVDGLSPTNIKVNPATGAVKTEVSGAGSGGTSSTDGEAFAADTTAGTAAMGVYESTPTTVADGDVGVVGMTANRELKVSITSGSSSGTEYTEDAASAADPAGGMTMARRRDTLTVSEVSADGDNIALNATSKGELHVKHTDAIPITDNGGSLTVDNAGLTELAAAINSSKVDVNIVSSDVATGGTSAADDADFTAGTTSGTPAMGVYESTPSTVTDGDLGTVGITADRRLKVLADLSATDNAVLDTIDAVLDEIKTDTESIETAVEAIQAGQLADGHNVTVDNGAGASAVNIQDGGNSITVDGTVAVTNAGITTIAGAVSGTEMQVDVLTMPTTTVQATNLDIRDLTNADVVTAELSAVDNAVLDTIDAVLDTIKTDTASIVTATQLIDDAISGSEMQVDVVGALPAGTNNIGDVDVLTLPALAAGTNAVGKLLPPDVDVSTHTNYAKKYYTNAGAVTDGIIWSPAAGKRWHVVSLIINVSAAATVTLEDDKAGGDEVVMKMELAANGGFTHHFGEKYPLASGEDAADLIITTTAGNVYVTAVGYEV